MKPISSNDIGSPDRSEIDSHLRHRATAHLVRIPEAAEITGLPASLLRKSFIREEKRPKNVPPPPPHKRIGRAVYILADALPAWIQNLGVRASEHHRRGRATVAERILRRQQGTG